MRRGLFLRIGGALCIAAVLHGSDPARAGDLDPSGLRRPSEPAKAAIAKGLAWLRASAAKPAAPVKGEELSLRLSELSPQWGPEIVFHTLRACGVGADDPACVAANAAMTREFDEHTASSRSVGADSLAAAVARTDLPTHRLAMYCIAIADRGTPSPAAVLLGESASRLEPSDAVWMTGIARSLETGQNAAGTWDPRLHGEAAQADLLDPDETAWALCGLEAAARSGVAVAPATWLKALRRIVEIQCPKNETFDALMPATPSPKKRPAGARSRTPRGWSYSGRAFGELDATAHTILSLLLCRDALAGDPLLPDALGAKSQDAVRGGIDWIESDLESLDRTRLKKQSVLEFGWNGSAAAALLAIARLGTASGVRRLGGDDWYDRLVETLCDIQDDDGSWPSFRGSTERDSELDAKLLRTELTCQALLCLAHDAPYLTFGGVDAASDAIAADFSPAANFAAPDLEELIDRSFVRIRRLRTMAEKDRLTARLVSAGPRIVGPLVARLESEDAPVRVSAFAVLRRATQLSFDFDPNGDPGKRVAAVERWAQWLDRNARKLRYDERLKRIVVAE